MKKLLWIALFVPILAFGQSVDVRGLTKEQITELVQARDKMLSPEVQVQSVSASVRKETAAWANLGTNIGTAMVSAAKELGLAANEFSQTSLGKIVTGIVVYKVMGRDILGVFFGSVILFFGFGMVTWLLFTKRFGQVKYEYKPMFWGLWQRKVVTEYKIENENVTGKLVFGAILLIFTMIVGINCIF